MNIIFLDIDGVLNCRTTQDRIDNTNIVGIESNKVKLLSTIVNETNSTIILTSTWKFDWDKNKNPNYIGDYLDKKLYEYELIITDKTIDYSYDRGTGIHKYLNEHSNIDNYVILDDSLFEDYDNILLEHLVLTDFRIGLIEEDVLKAIEILKK